MAKEITGEVEFKAGSEKLILLLDFNSLCELEKDFPRLMHGEIDMKPSSIRRIFGQGLQEHQPGTTDEMAGKVIQRIGMQEATALIERALLASFGTDAQVAGDPPVARPNRGAGSGR